MEMTQLANCTIFSRYIVLAQKFGSNYANKPVALPENEMRSEIRRNRSESQSQIALNQRMWTVCELFVVFENV